MTERTGMVDPSIFEFLQSKIDEDGTFGDVGDLLFDASNFVANKAQRLKDIRQLLEKQSAHPNFFRVCLHDDYLPSTARNAQAVLSRAHSTRSAHRMDLSCERLQ